MAHSYFLGSALPFWFGLGLGLRFVPIVHRGSSREAPSQLDGHAEESELVPSAPGVVGSAGVEPSASSSADRDMLGAQASRPPARSESLPVASNASSTLVRDGPSASSSAEAPVLPPPPPSVQLPDEQPVSAPEPDLLQPLPSDSATLSAPTAKRRDRESRITLPDEARQYIANMQESPLPTPPELPAAAALPTAFQHPPPPPQTQTSVLPSVTAVSPMNFEGTFAQRMAPAAPVQQPPAATNGVPSYPKTPTQSSVSGFQAPPPPPPLPTTHSRAAADPFGDTDDDYSLDGHSSTVYSPAESTSRQTIPTIIRNAPSMTSMNTLVNPTFIQTTSLRSSTQDDNASIDSSPIATSPTTSTMSTPPPNYPSAPPPQAQPPKMARTQSSQTTTTLAPPKLTPYDLGTAIILVPLSHIRANDRGKEVLSFVIEVALDQMAEREGWKIEKLYSDVLALDVRVRQVLGRSALKKIAPLPDAKLFKDNAPSKVDQRKVCKVFVVRCGSKTLFSSGRQCCRRIFRACCVRRGRIRLMWLRSLLPTWSLMRGPLLHIPDTRRDT